MPHAIERSVATPTMKARLSARNPIDQPPARCFGYWKPSLTEQLRVPAGPLEYPLWPLLSGFFILSANSPHTGIHECKFRNSRYAVGWSQGPEAHANGRRPRLSGTYVLLRGAGATAF